MKKLNNIILYNKTIFLNLNIYSWFIKFEFEFKKCMY